MNGPRYYKVKVSNPELEWEKDIFSINSLQILSAGSVIQYNHKYGMHRYYTVLVVLEEGDFILVKIGRHESRALPPGVLERKVCHHCLNEVSDLSNHQCEEKTANQYEPAPF